MVRSEQEAVEAVQKAKGEGYTGIKFYGTLNPAWVAPAAAEATGWAFTCMGMCPPACVLRRRSRPATMKSRIFTS